MEESMVSKREVAKKNIAANGLVNSGSLACDMCPFDEVECMAGSIVKTSDTCTNFCKKWLNEHPIIPEIKPILCKVYDIEGKGPKNAMVYGRDLSKENYQYITADGVHYQHAEPIIKKKMREMTRDEKLDWLLENLSQDGVPIRYPMVEDIDERYPVRLHERAVD